MGGSADKLWRGMPPTFYSIIDFVCVYVQREKLAEPISVRTEGFVTADLY